MTRYMTRTDRNRILGHWIHGPTSCPTCGTKIHRYRTAADTTAKAWVPAEDGRFWLDPVTNIIHVYDESLPTGDFWRFTPHSCIFACTPDEADQ